MEKVFNVPDAEFYYESIANLQLGSKENLSGQKINITHQLFPYPNMRLMELLMMIDIVKRAGAHDISMTIPYLYIQDNIIKKKQKLKQVILKQKCCWN
ncbi:ribose-phosphate pyrophosphokinase-like domain-containing protein [Candidatus Xenohaliotis californiensis]|uniref:ribose-phosphate pyrophosphokinase-like domain-containing protein n=1 Tax=Candidatus Xenohaliotis californiensis TaxID=84677 RepID=UPI0030C7A86F